MNPSDVHPDLLGEALSQSGQRMAQLGSLLASWAMVEARRIERRNAARAARSDQQLRDLREQENAARELARAGWAPSQDARWLASAGPVDVARAWSAATAYAGTDAEAASAVARCEDRLRQLHPYAMSWYDRLRGHGAVPFDAMRDALPLFARPPRARPGGPAAGRGVLASGESAQPTTGNQDQPDGYGQLWASGGASSPGDDRNAASLAGRSAANLAAESFPWTAVDAVRAGSPGSPHAAARPRAAAPQPAGKHRLAH